MKVTYETERILLVERDDGTIIRQAYPTMHEAVANKQAMDSSIEGMTVFDFVDIWRKQYAWEFMIRKRVYEYEPPIQENILPYFEKRLFKEVTAPVITEWLAHELEAGVEERDVRMMADILRSFFEKAIDWFYIEVSPMDQVDVQQIIEGRAAMTA